LVVTRCENSQSFCSFFSGEFYFVLFGRVVVEIIVECYTLSGINFYYEI